MRKDLPYLALLAPMLGFVGIFYIVPLLGIGYLSFSDPSLGFGNYQLLLTSSAVRRVLATTLYICAMTTILSVVIGYALAFAAHISTPRGRTIILFCVLVSFWMSVLIRAFSWMTLLRTEGVINSFLIKVGLISDPLQLMNNQLGVVIGMTHYMVPYAFLPILSNMASINPALVGAARGLGASPARTFASVFLPLTKPGIFAAVLLVFILCLGFYVTPVILGGGRTVIVAEYMTVQVQQTARWGVASAMSVILLGIVFALIVGFSRTMNISKMLGGRT